MHTFQPPKTGELFSIRTETVYPTNGSELIDFAAIEQSDNARPEIPILPDPVSEYDNIIIGCPIRWHTPPMITGTFLESYDPRIDVYPFSQSQSMDKEQSA